MKNMEDFCVTHSYTQRHLLLHFLLILLFLLPPTIILILYLLPLYSSRVCAKNKCMGGCLFLIVNYIFSMRKID
jgi:hypothetical protein